MSAGSGPDPDLEGPCKYTNKLEKPKIQEPAKEPELKTEEVHNCTVCKPLSNLQSPTKHIEIMVPVGADKESEGVKILKKMAEENGYTCSVEEGECETST